MPTPTPRVGLQARRWLPAEACVRAGARRLGGVDRRVALSIWPATSSGQALRNVRCVFDQLELVGGGFLSTQLATSPLWPGWPMPTRRRQ
jgi:hypothetical protein